MLHDPWLNASAYDSALRREKKRLMSLDTHSRDDLDGIIRFYGLDLVHELAMEEDARWEREKSDRQYDRDNEVL